MSDYLPPTSPQPQQKPRWQRVGFGAALVTGGLIAGIVTAGTLSANAAGTGESLNSASALVAAEDGTAPADASAKERCAPGRKPAELTGDTATKVKEAVLATYPGATVERMHQHPDGGYGAFVTKADGTKAMVEVDSSFAVTGEKTKPERPEGEGRHGRPGGPRSEGSNQAQPSPAPTG